MTMSRTDVAADSGEIGGYQIVERLGASGLSTVFRALEPSAGTTVALRVLQQRFDGNPGAVAAFRHHARAAAALDHPGVVTVLETHLDSPPYWFATQWTPGGTLAERLKSEGALPAGQTIAMWVELCAAVARAHEQGIAHGGITPDSVRFDAEGNPVLAGLGLSAELEAAAALGIAGDWGSMPYTSPEQLRGRAASRRGDAYSLCAVLYEALTARPPAPGAANRAPPSATNSSVGPRLDAVVRRGLASRWFRYADASRLSDALFDAMTNPQPDVASRRRARLLLVAVVVVASIVGVAAVHLSGGRRPGQVTSHATPYSPLGPVVHAPGETTTAGTAARPSAAARRSTRAAPASRPAQRRAATRRTNAGSVARRAPEPSRQVRTAERRPKVTRTPEVRSKPRPPTRATTRPKPRPSPESAGPPI
jgi:serine/threonine protein kinase